MNGVCVEKLVKQKNSKSICLGQQNNAASARLLVTFVIKIIKNGEDC